MRGHKRKRMTHEEVRKIILEKSVFAFFVNGIKAVTMDDIALIVGISKRTLYEHFTDKEALLLECMKKCKILTEQKREEIRETSSNQLEQMLRFDRFKNEQLMVISPLFYEEIKRYPKVMEYFQNEQKKQAVCIAQEMQQGVDDGIFRSDIDYTTYVYLLGELVRFTISQYYKDTEKLIPLIHTISLVNLRGICTPKGMQMLEDLAVRETECHSGMTLDDLRNWLSGI